MSKCELIQGDCIEEMQKLIEERVKVDLICTDPPYNVSKLNDNRDRSKLDSPIMRREKPVNYDFGEWDNMERQEFLDFTKEWYGLCVDLLREGGTFISFFSKEDVNYLGWIGKDMGVRYRNTFTWHKTNPVPSFRKVNYLSSCEYIYMGSKGESAWTFNFKQQKEMHNFFETPNKSSYGVTKHPTEKPVTLLKHLLEIHSNPNDLVLDCFMGSGSTAIGCIETQRNFIGIEKDKDYFKIAEDRVKEAQKQKRLL